MPASPTPLPHGLKAITASMQVSSTRDSGDCTSNCTSACKCSESWPKAAACATSWPCFETVIHGASPQRCMLTSHVERSWRRTRQPSGRRRIVATTSPLALETFSHGRSPPSSLSQGSSHSSGSGSPPPPGDPVPPVPPPSFGRAAVPARVHTSMGQADMTSTASWSLSQGPLALARASVARMGQVEGRHGTLKLRASVPERPTCA
mmetsp:Transcript_78787/g.222765  ORF Transcript_78787/g.222765 Transcript_78787/m.222765 type:complete len:206 (-) Transcript_78787:157-774(-)